MPNSTKVTLKQLRYFVRIVELGSISRTSEDLHIAQTALGLQVRALEDALGTALLLRHPKGVRATDQGRIVYERALAILRSVDDLTEEVRQSSEDKVRDIWLGLAPNLISAIGTQILTQQERRIPGFHLHLLESSRNNLLEAVQKEDLDWVIAHEAMEVEGCRSIPVLRESVQLICRPGTGLPPGPITLRDLLERDLVLDSGRRLISSVLANVAQPLGLTPRVKYEVDSVSTVKHLLLAEDVFGLFNHILVREEVERGELEVHSIVEPSLEITAYFVCRAQAPPRTEDLPVLRFIDDLLDDYIADHAHEEVRLGHLVSIVEPVADEPAVQADWFGRPSKTA